MTYPNELKAKIAKKTKQDKQILLAKLFKEADNWEEFVLERSLHGLDRKCRLFDPWHGYYKVRNNPCLSDILRTLDGPEVTMMSISMWIMISLMVGSIGKLMLGIGGEVMLAISLICGFIPASIFWYFGWCKVYVTSCLLDAEEQASSST